MAILIKGALMPSCCDMCPIIQTFLEKGDVFHDRCGVTLSLITNHEIRLDDCPLVELPPQWIPVTERLPKEDGDYLAWVCLDDNEPFYGIFPFDSNVPAFGYWEEYYDPVTYGREGSDFIEMRGITHWMPLPEPPKEEV